MTENHQADPNSVDPKSVEQRDREWLATVYRGDKEKDLTVRAVLAGMIFGGLMSLSNLYVGLKSGWGLGVDIAAVVVIFAVFKALRGIGIVRREFGMHGKHHDDDRGRGRKLDFLGRTGVGGARADDAHRLPVRLVAAHAVHRRHFVPRAVHGHSAEAADDPGGFAPLPRQHPHRRNPHGHVLARRRGDEEGRVAGHCGRLGSARRRTAGRPGVDSRPVQSPLAPPAASPWASSRSASSRA